MLTTKQNKILSHSAFGLLMTISIYLLVFSTINAYNMIGNTFPGFSFFDFGERYMFVNATNQTHWTGMKEGDLKFQDVVVAVDGRYIYDYSTIKEVVSMHPAGTPITYMVITWKDSEIRKVVVPSMTFSKNDFWVTYGLKLLVAIVLFIMIIVVYLIKPFGQGTWPFIIFNLSLSFFVLGSFAAGMNHSDAQLYWLANNLLPASLFHLVVKYPEEHSICRTYRFIIPGFYLLQIFLYILPSITAIRETSPYLIRNTVGFFALITGVVGVFFFISMFRLYRSTKKTSQAKTALKLRIKILTLGAFFAFIVPSALALLGLWREEFYISFNYVSLFFLVFPFSMAISLVQYNLFDVDSYLKKILITSVYSGVITTCYFAIFSLCFGTFVEDILYSPFFALFFALSTYLLSSPFSKLFNHLHQNMRSKNQKTYQQIMAELSQSLTSVLTRDEIMRAVSKTLINDLNIVQVSFWLKNTPEQTLSCQVLEELECQYKPLSDELREKFLLWETRTDPLFITEVQESPHFSKDLRQSFLNAFESLNAVLLFPLFVKKEITGMIFIGERLDSKAFTSGDIELLLPFSYQMAIALENASSYEKIQEFNESLERKVEERTEALVKTMEEKEQTQEQLVRSESLAAIGQLVAGVAHELNNPLGSAHSLVQSAVEIMEEKEELTVDDEDVIDDLKFVIKEQKRAKDIVSSLLDLSRQTKSYQEPVQMNQVIEDSIRILHNKYKYKQIKIDTQLQDNLPVMNGNFAQLGQVCLNIIQNAIQASPEKIGHITLKTFVKKDEILVQCKDNGTGIPEQALKDIFKPFFTTKSVGEGTGLGLYICHDIISRHQGSINVYNSNDGGAISEIRLPLKSKPMKAA